MRKHRALVVSLTFLLVLAAWPVAAHYYAKAKVGRYQRQLRAIGEKIEIAELTPHPTAEGLQTATAFTDASRSLSGRLLTNYPPLMKLAAPGRAIAASLQKPLPT